MQLERDLQLASFLAGVGRILADLGVLDNAKANSEHDQVQVCWVYCRRKRLDKANSDAQICTMGLRQDQIQREIGKMGCL